MACFEPKWTRPLWTEAGSIAIKKLRFWQAEVADPKLAGATLSTVARPHQFFAIRRKDGQLNGNWMIGNPHRLAPDKFFLIFSVLDRVRHEVEIVVGSGFRI